MNMDSLRDLFLKKIQIALDTESQLTSALSEMAPMAKHEDLKAALEMHRKETEEHKKKLEDLIAKYEMPGTAKKNEALAAMIATEREKLTQITDESVRDAALIASGQSAEHMEMAIYGTLISWGRALDETDAVDVFKSILSEEENADKKLSHIAEGGLFTSGINTEAV